MNYKVYVLVDEEDGVHACWLTSDEARTVLIEASWKDVSNLKKTYPGWKVQPYKAPSFEAAIKVFWKITEEFGFTPLNWDQLKDLEELWFA